MTKPREKTREELTAEIEDGKKKIRQFENGCSIFMPTGRKERPHDKAKRENPRGAASRD